MSNQKFQNGYDLLLDIYGEINKEDRPDSLNQLMRDAGDYLTEKWNPTQERYQEVISEHVECCKSDFREIGRSDLTAVLNIIKDSLINGIVRTRAAAALGKIGGSVKSEAKARASAKNGKKGGRPRKINVELKKMAGSSQGKTHEFRGTFAEVHEWVSKWTGVINDDEYDAYMEANDIEELNDAMSDDWSISEV